MRRKDGQLDRRTTAYRQEVERRKAGKEAVLFAVLVEIASIVTLLGSLWSRLIRRSKEEGSADSSHGQVPSQHPSRPRWRVWLVRGVALCLFSFACMTAAVIVEPMRGAESSG
jgi:ABC-type Fe3+ transport system permease subunit